MRRFLCVGMIVSLSSLPATLRAQTTAPSTQPASARSGSPAFMLDDAIAAFKKGRHDEAARLAAIVAKSFKTKSGPIEDALQIDVLHLMLAANIKLGRHPTAAEVANKLFQNATADRSLLLNIAICDVKQRAYVIRTARLLRDYVTANPKDEDAINLWGTAISILAKQSNPTELEEQTAAYLAIDSQLEATRPDMRRWGTQWITPREYSEIESKRNQVRYRIRDLESDLEYLKARLDEANERLQEAQANLRDVRRENAAYYRGVYERCHREYERIKNEFKAKKRQLEKTKDEMPMPAWVPPPGPFLPKFLAAK